MTVTNFLSNPFSLSSLTARRSGPAIAEDGDAHGDVTAAVMVVATMYSGAEGDGAMDFSGFSALVGDLLCLRDGVLWMPPERTQQVAVAIAKHAKTAVPSPLIELSTVVELASRWEAVGALPDVWCSGGGGLPSPAKPNLAQDLEALHERRRNDRPVGTTPAAPATPGSPTATIPSLGGTWGASAAASWVFMHDKCRGAPVGESILLQLDGWRFSDHGDGTGVVYFWPPPDAPDRDKMLAEGIHALPVARLGSAAAPSPGDAEAAPLPLHRGPSFSTPRLRRAEARESRALLAAAADRAAAAVSASVAGATRTAAGARLPTPDRRATSGRSAGGERQRPRSGAGGFAVLGGGGGGGGGARVAVHAELQLPMGVGVDAYNLVTYLVAGGAAAADGALQVDDEIVAVDGTEVRGGLCSIKDALDPLRQTHTIVAERPAAPPPPDPPPPAAAEPASAAAAPTTTREAEEMVDARLLSLGLRPVDAGGGGNCFFRSLAYQLPALLHDPERFHLLARMYTVAHMRRHRADYEDFVPRRDGESFEGYLQRMGRDGEWVEGETELHAAARVYNVNIWLFGYDEAHDHCVRVPQSNLETREIRVAHYHDVHYRAVERAETADVSSLQEI